MRTVEACRYRWDGIREGATEPLCIRMPFPAPPPPQGVWPQPTQACVWITPPSGHRQAEETKRERELPPHSERAVQWTVSGRYTRTYIHMYTPYKRDGSAVEWAHSRYSHLYPSFHTLTTPTSSYILPISYLPPITHFPAMILPCGWGSSRPVLLLLMLLPITTPCCGKDPLHLDVWLFDKQLLKWGSHLVELNSQTPTTYIGAGLSAIRCAYSGCWHFIYRQLGLDASTLHGQTTNDLQHHAAASNGVTKEDLRIERIKKEEETETKEHKAQPEQLHSSKAWEHVKDMAQIIQPGVYHYRAVEIGGWTAA